MSKVANILVGVLTAATIYTANIAYHAIEAMQAATELSRTQTLAELYWDRREQVNAEISNTSVLYTNDPATETGLYCQDGLTFHIVRHGERSRLDELAEELREISVKWAETYGLALELPRDIEEHKRRMFTVI